MCFYLKNRLYFFCGMDCDPSETRYKWSILMYNNVLWGDLFCSFILTAVFSYSLVSELTDLLLAHIFTLHINILLYFWVLSWVRSCEKGESWELTELVFKPAYLCIWTRLRYTDTVHLVLNTRLKMFDTSSALFTAFVV